MRLALLPNRQHAPRVAAAPELFAQAIAGHPTTGGDDLITGVWEGLAVHNSVHCPVCGGTMVSRSAARADVREGGCGDCGAKLY